LCLRDKKKNSEQKKKIPFSDLIFFTYREGEEREDERRKTEKEYSFCKQGEITPLLQKQYKK